MEVFSLDRAATCTAAVAIGSWIFLGSNAIFLGGVGAFAGLLGLCCLSHYWATSFAISSAAALHISAFLLGITAIHFYLTKPGKDWGPSLFGDRVHGAWWWIALSVALSLVNLAAGVLDLLIVRRTCTTTEQPSPLTAPLDSGDRAQEEMPTEEGV